MAETKSKTIAVYVEFASPAEAQAVLDELAWGDMSVAIIDGLIEGYNLDDNNPNVLEITIPVGEEGQIESKIPALVKKLRLGPQRITCNFQQLYPSA